jgi:hypothetical protein
MSDQTIGQPVYQPAPTLTPAKGARRKGPLAIGLVLLVGGVGAGAGLYLNATSQYKDAVTSLQRAPVGCDTELDFTGTGTFTFYIETKGKVGKLRGDCANADAEYSRPSGTKLPIVALTLVDADGAEATLPRTSSASYDVDGYVGTATRSVTITKASTYTLSVESDDTDFAIAIGRNPRSDYDSHKLLAIAIAAVGLLLGGLLTVLGMRRKTAPAPAPPSPYGASAGYSMGTGQQDPYMAPPTWAPAEQTHPAAADPWAPQAPPPVAPPAPAPSPLPPPRWQPPQADEPGAGSSWGAPQQ